ncbi:hypothetical protein BHE74_00014538, partial [Ensete ventricosum]
AHREMSKSGAMHLATRVGGSIKKEDVQSAVDRYAHRSYSGSVLFCMSYLGTSICDCTATWLADAIAVSRGMNFQRDEYFLMLYCLFRYEKYHVCFGGEEEARKANYSDMLNFHYRDQQQWVSDFQRRSKRILLFYFEGQYSGICWHCAGRKCESFIIPGEGRRGACGRWQVRQIAAFVLVETPSDTCVLIEAASDLFLVAGRRSSHQYTSFWPESLSHVLEKVQGSAFACYRSPV